MAFEEGKEGEREKLRLALRLERPEAEGPEQGKDVHVIQRQPNRDMIALRDMACDTLKESGPHAHGLSNSLGDPQT